MNDYKTVNNRNAKLLGVLYIEVVNNSCLFFSFFFFFCWYSMIELSQSQTMVIFRLAPPFVLEQWCFNNNPTIEKIYKLFILCSIIFLKLYCEISNIDVPLKWTCKIFFFNTCFFIIGLVKHGRSKLAGYIWLRSS